MNGVGGGRARDIPWREPAALADEIAERVNAFGCPAALVFNCHITGLAVARSLGRHGVPVIGLDPDPGGYGLRSRYTVAAGWCPNVLAGEEPFIAYLERLAERLEHPAVLFPTNDEWVMAVARYAERLRATERYLIPFADAPVIDRVLDKVALYRAARELGIPIPETWEVAGADLASLADRLPYPCILKPAEQRRFYDRFRQKVLRVEGPADLPALAEQAAGFTMLAQDIVPARLADFVSCGAYVDAAGEARGVFVGRKLEQYPAGFGTGCLVDSYPVEEVARAGVAVLRAFGYHGVAEVEFIRDPRDGVYKLIDVNTRVWKWVGLPAAAGVDLPLLAYLDATGTPETAPPQREALKWVHLKDYLKLAADRQLASPEQSLTDDEWLDLLRGNAAGEGSVVEAVHWLEDPAPALQMLREELDRRPYYCAC